MKSYQADIQETMTVLAKKNNSYIMTAIEKQINTLAKEATQYFHLSHASSEWLILEYLKELKKIDLLTPYAYKMDLENARLQELKKALDTPQYGITDEERTERANQLRTKIASTTKEIREAMYEKDIDNIPTDESFARYVAAHLDKGNFLISLESELSLTGKEQPIFPKYLHAFIKQYYNFNKTLFSLKETLQEDIDALKKYREGGNKMKIVKNFSAKIRELKEEILLGLFQPSGIKTQFNLAFEEAQQSENAYYQRKWFASCRQSHSTLQPILNKISHATQAALDQYQLEQQDEAPIIPKCKQ